MANKSIILCFALLSIACVTIDPKPRKPTKVLPPPPWDMSAVSSEPYDPKLIDAPGTSRVRLWWTNTPTIYSNLYETVLQSTTNLTIWTQVGVFGYSNVVTVILTNRPPAELYRIFHRIK